MCTVQAPSQVWDRSHLALSYPERGRGEGGQKEREGGEREERGRRGRNSLSPVFLSPALCHLSCQGLGLFCSILMALALWSTYLSPPSFLSQSAEMVGHHWFQQRCSANPPLLCGVKLNDRLAVGWQPGTDTARCAQPKEVGRG